jgi:hypothetical protein
MVLTAASMKMTIFWDAAPCSLVETDRRFRGAHCLHHHGDEWVLRPNGGGSKHLWNISQFLPDYMAHHPRRQSPSVRTLQPAKTCHNSTLHSINFHSEHCSVRASPKIPHILWNATINYCVHNSWPLDTVLSQMNPVLIITPHFKPMLKLPSHLRQSLPSGTFPYFCNIS